MLIGMPFASTMGLLGLAGEADGDSVAAQSQWPGDHAQQQDLKQARREDFRRR